MQHGGSFAWAFALGVALVVSAVAGAVAGGDRIGLGLNELFRAESLPEDQSSALDDQLRYQFEILAGSQRFTDADLADRFVPAWPEGLPADFWNALTDGYFATDGTVGFVRVVERQERSVQSLGVAENGTAVMTLVQLTEDDRIERFDFEPDSVGRPRLPVWESALIVLAGAALVATAAAVWRYGDRTSAWALILTSMATLAGVLLLSDIRAAYTVGRVVPSVVVVFAVALLARPRAGGWRRWLLAVAVAAGLVGAVAPFVRNATRIGHPEVVGAFADNATLYRVLLSSGAGLTFLAMSGVVAANSGRLRSARQQVDPAALVSGGVATVWAVAALGAAVDYGFGDGSWASGPLTAVGLSALALVPAAVLVRFLLPDEVAGATGLFVAVTTLAAVVAVVGVAGAVSGTEKDGLAVGELLRVEPLPSDPASPVDDHLRFTFEAFAGTRSITDADIAERWTPSIAAATSVAEINSIVDPGLGSRGTVRFVRIRQQQPGLVWSLGVGEDGSPWELLLGVLPDGKLDTWGFSVDPTDPRRLPGWESTLTLMAGAAFLAGAVVALRHGAVLEAWTLLAGMIPVMGGLLVLSDSRVAYTAGRIVPALTLVIAVVLLVAPNTGRLARVVMTMALAAAIVGAVAPLARDSSLVGHPSVVGAFTDTEAVYRGLLSSSAGLAVLALVGVVALNIGRLEQASRQMRPALLVASSVAALLGVAALGSAIDYAVDDGTLANGPFRAITLLALTVISVLVIFRLVISSWERLELATLVIDLEGDDADLQPAVAKALEDPSLEVLSSPDGLVLVSEAGEVVLPEDLGPGRALTRIQSGDHLVGGLVHSVVVQRNPARIEAVAAAAGMALQVSSLNQQVTAQLAEVGASRARILQASDTARRQVERDLHDGAQQRLVAVGLRLERARRQASTEHREQLAELLEDATTEVRDTIDEIRAVSRGRQPSLLAERGLATAVDALAERAPVPVDIDISAEQLPPNAEITAYYVVAEALTNLAKHAEASAAQISISRPNGAALVTIRDDGKGGARITAGSGLEGLSDRVAAIGGTFNISSGPGGTTLEATIPCA